MEVEYRNLSQKVNWLIQEFNSLRTELREVFRSSVETEEDKGHSRRVSIIFNLRRKPNAPLTGGKTITHELTVSGDLSTLASLSLRKTAVIFALLVDLRSRRDQGTAIDVLSTAAKVLEKMAPHLAESAPGPEALRAQLNRLNRTDFLRDHHAAPGVTWSSKVSPKPFRLEILRTRTGQPSSEVVHPEAMDLQLETDDPVLQDCLNELIPHSLLDLLRRNTVKYIAGGPDGFDQLFLEFFDHPYPIKEMSMFFKPSIITYPPELLGFLQSSQQDKDRRDIAHEGLANGRVRFLELLNAKTLDDMTTCNRYGEYKMYGPAVTAQHVADHLHQMAVMVEKLYPNYELRFSKRPLPFFFSTFEIERKAAHECYTTFFRQMVREHDPDVECFAIFDKSVFDSIQARVVPKVAEDTETVSDPESVKSLILGYRTRLLEQGPTIEE